MVGGPHRPVVGAEVRLREFILHGKDFNLAKTITTFPRTQKNISLHGIGEFHFSWVPIPIQFPFREVLSIITSWRNGITIVKVMDPSGQTRIHPQKLTPLLPLPPWPPLLSSMASLAVFPSR